MRFAWQKEHLENNNILLVGGFSHFPGGSQVRNKTSKASQQTAESEMAGK